MLGDEGGGNDGSGGAGGEAGDGEGGGGGDGEGHGPKALQVVPNALLNGVLPAHAQLMRTLFASDKPAACCRV